MTQSRRGFLRDATGTLFASAVKPQAPPPPSRREQWNVLYIHSHDTGRYLRPYGYDVPTPQIARLARSGTLFRQMFSAAPVCSASRAALLTGQCPHRNGMNGLAHLGWSLNDYSKHFLYTARRYGYRSTLAGLQHIAADPRMIGFDELLPHASNSARDVAPVAARFLRSRPQEPFFLDVGFFETHREYPDAVDDPSYIVPPAPIPDTPETRLDMARFHASARLLDRGVGEVLDALEATGLRERTLILSTTDHGIAFPDMKCNLRDSGLGVSMILSGPPPFDRPHVCDTLLSQLDVYPTLCDYLGFEKPVWLEGKSFLPLVRNQSSERLHDVIFGEVTYHAAYEPKRCARTTRWKYIRHFDGRHAPNLPNCDDGLSKTYWMQHDWRANESIRAEELYDLVFDPIERNNLTDDKRHREILAMMQNYLHEWMTRTDDPLLRGPVPLPPDAHTVNPDSVSPASLAVYAPSTQQ